MIYSLRLLLIFGVAIFYGAATPLKTFACAPQPLASAELSAADAIIRATLQNYEILVPGMKARLTLNVVEHLKGRVRSNPILDQLKGSGWRDDSIYVLWENSSGRVYDRWDGSNDVLVALNRLKPSRDDADYQIIHPGCHPPSIIEFSALNVWRIMRETGD